MKFVIQEQIDSTEELESITIRTTKQAGNSREKVSRLTHL